jgi:hypothetical protein
MFLLRGLLSALLPSPERERLARENGLNAPKCSFFLGLLQGPIGVAFFVTGGLSFMRGTSLILSWGMLENWQPGMTTNDIRATGLIGWLSWFLHPLAWPPAYLALIGLGRCLTFAIAGEAMGEPLVIAAMRLAQAWNRRSQVRRREAELGPIRPDRILRQADDIVILTCREKKDWRVAVTIEIGGRFYRLKSLQERRDGPHRALAYHLTPQPPGALVRRLVRYIPPPG